jgi:hypothetical protein
MTLNQQGLITWTPEANQLGNHTVKVQVIDGRGGFAEQEWAIAVVSQRSNNQSSTNSSRLLPYKQILTKFINII